MSIDYQAMDDEADNELKELYAQDSAEEAEPSPETSGTEDNQETNEAATAEVSQPEETTPQNTEEQQSEPVVSESRYKESVRAMNRAQQEAAELRKQNANLQAQIDQLSTQREAPEHGASFDSVVEDYPEIAKPFLDEINQLKQQLNAVKGATDRYQQNEAQFAQQQHEQEILKAHPDAFDLAATDDFQVWLANQAPVIQYAINQGGAKDVVSALNLYRAEHSVPEQKPKVDKLAAARQAASPNVKTTAKPEERKTFSLKDIEKMSLKEFNKYEAQIDEAMLKGEIY